MVLDRGAQEREDRYGLTGSLPPLAISRHPARLPDGTAGRLATVKGVAQLGATLGREFSSRAAAGSPRYWTRGRFHRTLHAARGKVELLISGGATTGVTYLFKQRLNPGGAYQYCSRVQQQSHQRMRAY